MDFVGLVTEFQRFPWVSLLSTRRAFALLTLALGFPGRVFARWLIGVAAIQTEQGFDSPQLGLQCGDFSLEASHLGSKSFAVGTGLLRDAPTLPVSASQVPLLSSYDFYSFILLVSRLPEVWRRVKQICGPTQKWYLSKQQKSAPRREQEGVDALKLRGECVAILATLPLSTLASPYQKCS